MNEITNIENKIQKETIPYKSFIKPSKTDKREEEIDDSESMKSNTFKFSENPSLEKLRSIQSKFVSDRNWNQFQSPRNLLLAMIGEVGELSEIFQWKGEVEAGLPDWSNEEREHLGQELSDVFLYLMRLSEECKIDLPAVAAAKIEHNIKKYPISKFYGTSKKYNQ